MRVRAFFVGLTKARVRSIVSSVEESSDIMLVSTVAGGSGGNIAELIKVSDAAFVNRCQKEAKLIQVLEEIRKRRPDIPIVLAYESEPDGRAYLLANRFNCWLFSEGDRLNRTLTPEEIGEALAEKTQDAALKRRLIEVSLSAGPCSTGT